jgi:hypothetical protein
MIIRQWAGFNSFQVVSPAYSINMRNLREYYERNFTPASTRNESLTGALQDTVGRIFEHMQNEECSFAHLVRAVSILFWLVKLLEDNGVSLDRQTREEVEVCAIGLTREYLQRGRYDHEHIQWTLEWASARTIIEIAPQVLHTLKEGPQDQLLKRDQGPGRLLQGFERLQVLLQGLERLERLQVLQIVEGFMGFQAIEGVEVSQLTLAFLVFQALRGLQGPQVLQGLQGPDLFHMGLQVRRMSLDEPLLGFARLALDKTID